MEERNKIVLFKEKSECCACGACVAVCPKQAISMKEDEFGFLYPNIDYSKCISCGICKNMCGYKMPRKRFVPQRVLAAACKDVALIEKSASGGLFGIIAEQILHSNGVVYGAMFVYDGVNLKLIHKGVDNISELSNLQGSKYVQSCIGDAYKSVEKDLENNKKVLFSGTPCQINGLKTYLKKEYDNLLTIDIICHGVPSSKWFQEYLELMEKKLQGKIFDYKFRDKKYGQGYHTKISYRDKDGIEKEYHSDGNLTSYLYYFLRADMNRENCYTCPFAGKKRVSDITLGDFWGVNKIHENELEKSNMSDEKGISCVLINTEKGLNAVANVEDMIESFESTYEKVALYNAQLVRPAVSKGKRELLLELYSSGGYSEIDRYYKRRKVAYRAYHHVKGLMPKKFRKKIKKLL